MSQTELVASGNRTVIHDDGLVVLLQIALVLVCTVRLELSARSAGGELRCSSIGFCCEYQFRWLLVLDKSSL